LKVSTSMLSMFPNLSAPAIELKGNLLTLMVLRLLYPNNERILSQLAEKIAKAPGFFQHAPVVIDLHALHEHEHEFENIDHSELNQLFDLAEIVQALRSHGLVPVGIRGGNPAQQEIALSLNLGILSDSKTVERPRRYPEAEPVTPPLSTTKIITQPVRSGQQIVSMYGDLIILSTVSHGAEILAHRNIHVYGALRGRALAGVNGDHEARIFCQQLEAELVSIAGQYQINEELPENLQGKSAQIYLIEETLKIEPLF